MVSAEREPIWNLYMNLSEIGSLPPKSVELAGMPGTAIGTDDVNQCILADIICVDCVKN